MLSSPRPARGQEISWSIDEERVRLERQLLLLLQLGVSLVVWMRQNSLAFPFALWRGVGPEFSHAEGSETTN